MRAAWGDAAGGPAAIAAGCVRDGDTLARVRTALLGLPGGPALVLPDGDGTGAPLPRRDPDPPARFDAFAWLRGGMP